VARGLGGDLAVNRIKPAYQQVANQVRELVLGGSLVPGDRLPVEADLADACGVSRSTVARRCGCSPPMG